MENATKKDRIRQRGDIVRREGRGKTRIWGTSTVKGKRAAY